MPSTGDRRGDDGRGPAECATSSVVPWKTARADLSGRGLSKKVLTGARPTSPLSPERRVMHVVKLGDVDIAR